MAIHAFAQTVSPVADSKEGTASTPDFSGMWVHPYFPGVEPPASGPGPIFNRLHRPNGAGGAAKFVGDYTNPILSRGGGDRKRHGETSLANMTYPTPSKPVPGPPGCPNNFIPARRASAANSRTRSFSSFTLLGPEFRHVRLNQSHPAMRDAILVRGFRGQYEGDTLVVDTVAVKADRPFCHGRYVRHPHSARRCTSSSAIG